MTPPPQAPLEAEGAPGQVFQSIADNCHDQGITSLKRLIVYVEGATKEAVSDVRSLGLAIPQMGKGVYYIQQENVAEFGHSENLSLIHI